MRNFIPALATAVLLSATASLAQEAAASEVEAVTISRALAAGSLHDGPLDMVAYWLDGEDGALELTATFRDRATDDEPMRIVMPMQDGDALSFGMPGYRGVLYSFARTGREISISVEIKPQLISVVIAP
jgi:hypothetical protein